ncbi:hypothetical protein [Rhodanobacter lindaniclasticus]|uniref:Uncharacterized protein n=1 Tax=Rhodanobacter lindaniclasticus TaxID=75310 RepID=A0A4S3K6G4_9GAMM|nr:hypothetical protein [Rhodanobacter lindaniclasticus]THD03716.1 hypothetical protein B1991_18215 [Rhodanobacter lindaniclasticus]
MARSTETASLILKADATQITKGSEALDKLTVSADGAQKSVEKLGETEEQAAKRIKDMVASSMEQVRQQNASIASGQRHVQMTDAQRAAVDKLKASTNSQADISARGAALLAAEDRARKAATVGVAE